MTKKIDELRNKLDTLDTSKNPERIDFSSLPETERTQILKELENQVNYYSNIIKGNNEN